jgi:hypothetical protein
LQFAGYDVECDWSDGGHNVTRSTEIFPQVMQWIWRDWPSPQVVRATQNDFLKELLSDEDEGWVKIGDGADLKPVTRIIYPDLTNIAMIPSQPAGNTVWQYLMVDGKPSHGEPFYWLHNDDYSRPLDIQTITFDHNGNLWAVTSVGIQVCDQNGRVRAILRLPQGCAPVSQIDITQGLVVLSTATATWGRHFNVAGPTLGLRPPSQGQG